MVGNTSRRSEVIFRSTVSGAQYRYEQCGLFGTDPHLLEGGSSSFCIAFCWSAQYRGGRRRHFRVGPCGGEDSFTRFDRSCEMQLDSTSPESSDRPLRADRNRSC